MRACDTCYATEVDTSLCDSCSESLCARCAAEFEVDGEENGWDRRTYVKARCLACAVEQLTSVGQEIFLLYRLVERWTAGEAYDRARAIEIMIEREMR